MNNRELYIWKHFFVWNNLSLKDLPRIHEFVSLPDQSKGFFDNVDVNKQKPLFKDWKGTKVPILFSESTSENWYRYEGEKCIFNYDLISNAFYFLSLWQEYHSDVKDRYGRYPFSESFQSKNNCLDIPLVQVYLDIIKEGLGRLVLVQKSNELEVMLSHDIDKIHNGWKEDTLWLLKNKRDFFTPFSLAYKRFFQRDIYHNILDISELEQKYGAISTWFFLPKKGKVGSVPNADYEISEVEKDIEELKEKSFEIGVHGSFGTGYGQVSLINEKNKVSDSCLGNRFHFLNIDVNKSFDILEQSKFVYDSSLGFAEKSGFRCGTTKPFKPYNFRTGKEHDVIEIPLLMMDTTFEQARYEGGGHKNLLKANEKWVDTLQSWSGVYSILFHNNFFTPYKYAGWREAYELMLAILKEKKAVFKTGSEIANQFNKKFNEN